MNEDLLLIKKRREREFQFNKEMGANQNELERQKSPSAKELGRLPTVMEMGMMPAMGNRRGAA